MVYCKKWDDNVITSFVTLYQHVFDTYEHIFIYTDDWVLEELQKKGTEDAIVHNKKSIMHFKNLNEQER